MKKSVTLSAIAFSAVSLSLSEAATLLWDGGAGDGLLTSANNWNPDQAPANGDTLNITTSTTVSHNNNLPSGLTINLSNGAMLSETGGVIRLNGATINVGAGSGLVGGFWDLNNATITFDDGAIASMSNWENKGANDFTFNFGPTGFTTLAPGTFRNDGNNTASPGALIANDSYTVDLANFAGALGTYTIIDYGSDGEGISAADFQGAPLNVINSGGFTGEIFWNDTDHSLQIRITPEPSRALLLLGGLFVVAFRRRR